MPPPSPPLPPSPLYPLSTLLPCPPPPAVLPDTRARRSPSTPLLRIPPPDAPGAGAGGLAQHTSGASGPPGGCPPVTVRRANVTLAPDWTSRTRSPRPVASIEVLRAPAPLIVSAIDEVTSRSPAALLSVPAPGRPSL